MDSELEALVAEVVLLCPWMTEADVAAVRAVFSAHFGRVAGQELDLGRMAHGSLESEVLPMFMHATILDAEVNAFFDGVKANVYDLDEKQTYEALIVDGLLGLPELLELKRQKPPAPSDLLVQAAAQVEMPPLMQPLPVFVKRIRLNKGFMKLVCRLAPAQ
jgi:hypothetical protein